MFTCFTTVDVRRPIGEVFDFVADARNRPRWDNSVDSEELTSPEPIGVGTTVRTKLRSMGRRYQYDWKVTRYQRPQRMTIESTSGPLPTTLEYHLVEREDGTEVRFTVTGQPTGVMRLLQPVLSLIHI